MLSCKTLLEQSSLGLRVKVEGAPGTLGAPLLWVHNTELLDPSQYVRERELVLTNGLWHNGDNGADFVAGVVRVGGAGIVYGLRTESPHTPEDLMLACRRAELPLLELPIDVPFTAVTQAAAAALAEQRQASLTGMVRRGTALADAISHGSGALGVLEVLRQDHELPLAVVERSGRVLASAGGAMTAESAQAVGRALRLHPPPLEVDLGEQGAAALYLVLAMDKADAALVCLRPIQELSAAEHDALTQAARYLSLEVARGQLARSVEARFAGEMLEMIHSGQRAPDELRSRLEAFGIASEGPMVIVAAAYAGGDVAADAELAAVVGEFFPQQGLAAVVAEGTRDVVAIVPWYGPERGETELAQLLLDHVRRRVPDTGVVAGIGGPAAGATRLRAPLAEAREACRVLRGRSGGSPIARFGDLGAHRLLLGAGDPDTVQRVAESVLRPLREYDRRQNGRLESTVRSFLDHDAGLSSTAKALFIHVNTLRNRLAKAAEMTGCDVTTTEGRVDMFLAYQADAMLDRSRRRAMG